MRDGAVVDALKKNEPGALRRVLPVLHRATPRACVRSTLSPPVCSRNAIATAHATATRDRDTQTHPHARRWILKKREVSPTFELAYHGEHDHVARAKHRSLQTTHAGAAAAAALAHRGRARARCCSANESSAPRHVRAAPRRAPRAAPPAASPALRTSAKEMAARHKEFMRKKREATAAATAAQSCAALAAPDTSAGADGAGAVVAGAAASLAAADAGMSAQGEAGETPSAAAPPASGVAMAAADDEDPGTPLAPARNARRTRSWLDRAGFQRARQPDLGDDPR